MPLVFKFNPRDLHRGHRQLGRVSLNRLQAGHLVPTDRLVFDQLGCPGVTMADGLDLLMELRRSFRPSSGYALAHGAYPPG